MVLITFSLKNGKNLEQKKLKKGRGKVASGKLSEL